MPSTPMDPSTLIHTAGIIEAEADDEAAVVRERGWSPLLWVLRKSS